MKSKALALVFAICLVCPYLEEEREGWQNVPPPPAPYYKPQVEIQPSGPAPGSSYMPELSAVPVPPPTEAYKPPVICISHILRDGTVITECP
jgi:hypothetical protein